MQQKQEMWWIDLNGELTCIVVGTTQWNTQTIYTVNLLSKFTYKFTQEIYSMNLLSRFTQQDT